MTLPQWVSRAHAPVKLLRVSRREMMEDMKEQEAIERGGKVYLLLPQRQLLLLNAPGPEDQETKELPSYSLNRLKGSPGNQGSKQLDHRKAPIESV